MSSCVPDEVLLSLECKVREESPEVSQAVGDIVQRASETYRGKYVTGKIPARHFVNEFVNATLDTTALDDLTALRVYGIGVRLHMEFSYRVA